MAAHVEEPIAFEEVEPLRHSAQPHPTADPAMHEHLLRSVQDGRKALKRATLALTFSVISATGAWTNFSVTVFRALHHH